MILLEVPPILLPDKELHHQKTTSTQNQQYPTSRSGTLTLVAVSPILRGQRQVASEIARPGPPGPTG